MLRLFTENPEAVRAVIPVRWCVEKGVLDELKREEVENPYVLLSVEHDGREESRDLVPLSKMLSFVDFLSSGKHVIHASVVWNETGEVKPLRKAVFAPTIDGQGQPVFRREVYARNEDGSVEFSPDYFCGHINNNCTIASISKAVGSLEVNVGSEFFAPEPAKWEKWWVNLWFELPPRNQCFFRRRRFVAYIPQPPAVLLWILFLGILRSLYAGVSLLLGMRDVHFSPVFHPFKYTIRAVCPRVGEYEQYLNNEGFAQRGYRKYWSARNNFFFTRKDGARRSGWFFFLHPLVVLAITAGSYGIYRLNQWRLLAMAVLGVIALVLFVFSLTRLLPKLSKKLYEWRWTRTSAREEDKVVARLAERQRALAEMLSSLEPLVCDTVALPARVSALPRDRQTVSLRFQEFKAAVCKPFARG